MEVRKLGAEEKNEALELVLKTFMEFEAPDYSEQGIKSFTEFVKSKEQTDSLEMYGALENEKIVGVIATRKNGSHISLFFVDGKLHKQGIGKKLFSLALANCTAGKMTVNSSPYAVEIYRRLGFSETDNEQLTDGIRYTPMNFIK